MTTNTAENAAANTHTIKLIPQFVANYINALTQVQAVLETYTLNDLFVSPDKVGNWRAIYETLNSQSSVVDSFYREFDRLKPEGDSAHSAKWTRTKQEVLAAEGALANYILVLEGAIEPALKPTHPGYVAAEFTIADYKAQIEGHVFSMLAVRDALRSVRNYVES
jgi:hypothetical protein